MPIIADTSTAAQPSSPHRPWCAPAACSNGSDDVAGITYTIHESQLRVVNGVDYGLAHDLTTVTAYLQQIPLPADEAPTPGNDGQPKVCIGGLSVYLTPDQARQLAGHLVALADAAEYPGGAR